MGDQARPRKSKTAALLPQAYQHLDAEAQAAIKRWWGALDPLTQGGLSTLWAEDTRATRRPGRGLRVDWSVERIALYPTSAEGVVVLYAAPDEDAQDQWEGADPWEGDPWQGDLDRYMDLYSYLMSPQRSVFYIKGGVFHAGCRAHEEARRWLARGGGEVSGECPWGGEVLAGGGEGCWGEAAAVCARGRFAITVVAGLSTLWGE
jgi:hypothetical protein